MTNHIWRWIVIAGLGAAAIGAAGIYVTYSRDMRLIEEQLSSASQIADTGFGRVEYTAWGDGPSVLVLHGAGGGYDQGVLLANAFVGNGFRFVAPSRFGYLRSTLPADASTAAQADAFADLLDALDIDRVAIVAMSGGVPPALQFAERYPGRTSALVLLSSAPFTPLSAADQDLPLPAWLYQALFSTNFPFWLIHRISPGSLDTVFDVKPGLREHISSEDQALVAALVEAFQPVTGRVAGLANEGAAIDPGARYALAEIAVPALVIHARDDGINPFPIGEFTAANLPGSEWMPIDTGGHLLLGHQAEVRERVRGFLLDRADGSSWLPAAEIARN